MGEGREIRYNFDGSFMDFLDAAYKSTRQENGRRMPVGGPETPEFEPIFLAKHIHKGIVQFGREEAFAILINPEDKFRLEMVNAELSGTYLADAIESAQEAESITFEGLILQAAHFIRAGTYVVVGEEDYREMTRPENIE